MNKGLYIKEIKDGQQVEGLFLVKEMTRAETRTGNPYLSLTVMDKSGELAARIWEDADRYAGFCQAGQFVKLSGQAQAYKSVLQLKVNDLLPVAETEVGLADFVPTTPYDIDQMVLELRDLANGLGNPHLVGLLRSFFQSRPFMELFKKAPAAKLMHHAYMGGLLEHTLSVTRLAESVCRLYPTIDRAMLLTGAILHDVGKVAEFSFDSFPFDYTDRGRLVGHMVLGIEMIQDRIVTLADFPEELAVRLNHLILSHHGRHEYGSPVVPMTLEAFVLSFVDDLDSKINYFGKLGEQAVKPGYQWSDYQRTLERFLFIHGNDGVPQTLGPTPGTPKAAGNEKGGNGAMEIDPRQTSLWKK